MQESDKPLEEGLSPGVLDRANMVVEEDIQLEISPFGCCGQEVVNPMYY
jgi:hypothetical protein